MSECIHCGTRVPLDAADPSFCCSGCSVVHRLLQQEGLGRYYQLAGGNVTQVAEAPQRRSLSWLEPLQEQAEQSPGGVCSLELDVQGIHCAACVWLMNELFRRQEGGADLEVNPALGKVRVRWRKGAFDLAGYLRGIERFGYLFGPSRKRAEGRSLELPLRLGISFALTMNVMLFSVSFYFGLSPAEGELFGLFTRLSVALSALNVLVGGWPFFRAAAQALRARVLHLDLPIALGILGVFFTSLLQVRDGRGDLAYFDTLNTFVFLMLVGRWLQQRVLESNRRFLLEDDGAEGLTARRLEAGALTPVPVPKVRAGETLLVAPGDLVPVEARLLDPEGAFSTDWISGESRPRQLTQGQTVPAGAFNSGSTALRIHTLTDYAQSPLSSLLRRGPAVQQAGAHTRFWDLLARGWSAGVLVVATAGLLLWWPAGPERALEIAIALLVVTCPCAIGIALPLAYELANSRLRRGGFFIRSPQLLDKLPRVRQLLFDKTGTLTLGRLELLDRAPLDALSGAERTVAFNLAVRSNHPVSRCLASALSAWAPRFETQLQAREVPGKGVETFGPGPQWRLGHAAWAAPGSGAVGTVLACDGRPVAAFTLGEALRTDARRELSALQQAGYRVWLISGDSQDRVRSLAATLQLPLQQTLSSQRPEDKAAAVEALDRGDTLFLGDGVNDSLAFQRALCAGTPAIDRPVMPSRSDFFLLGEGLSPLRTALAVSLQLRGTVRTVLALALVYNLGAVLTSLAGAMSPLRAAIAMPVSSLALLLFTAWRLTRAAPRAAPAPVSARPVPREVPA